MKNVIKSTVKRKYVVGIYLPTLTVYFYWGRHGWTKDLQEAYLFSTADNAHGLIKKSPPLFGINVTPRIGMKLSVSKVFVKSSAIVHRNQRIFNLPTKITLTKPNYYEKLCAVVNNI